MFAFNSNLILAKFRSTKNIYSVIKICLNHRKFSVAERLSLVVVSMAHVFKNQTSHGPKFYEFLCKVSLVDVTLSAEGQFIKAHRLILAASSGWFEVRLLT